MDDSTNPQVKKIPLEQVQELKFYLFTTRQNGLNIVMPQERVFYTLAYDKEEAMQKSHDYVGELTRTGIIPQNQRPVPYGDIDVKDLLDKIQLSEEERSKLRKPVAQPGFGVVKQKAAELTPSEPTGGQQLVYDLYYVRDKVLRLKVDKDLLQGIITKVEKYAIKKDKVASKRKG